MKLRTAMEQIHYRVSKSIPMPKKVGRGRDAKYNFPELSIGESFNVKTVKECKSARARFYKKEQTICIRKEGEGFRIWRVT